jgi:hypothetical protein
MLHTAVKQVPVLCIILYWRWHGTVQCSAVSYSTQHTNGQQREVKGSDLDLDQASTPQVFTYVSVTATTPVASALKSYYT